MDNRLVVVAPRAERDLRALPRHDANLVVEDLELLRFPPWPPGKVKKLHGLDYWEIKTGDYRSLFRSEGKKVVILRVIHRKELFRSIKHLDLIAVACWLLS